MASSLYNPTIARSLAKRAPSITGYYTTKEAAARLGVDVSTLNYRRDAADAQAFREIIGESDRDETFLLLNEARKRFGRYHYYEKKLFDQFVKKYLERESVQRARKTGMSFEEGSRHIGTHNIKTKGDITKVATILERLMNSDGELVIQIYSGE